MSIRVVSGRWRRLAAGALALAAAAGLAGGCTEPAALPGAVGTPGPGTASAGPGGGLSDGPVLLSGTDLAALPVGDPGAWTRVSMPDQSPRPCGVPVLAGGRSSQVQSWVSRDAVLQVHAVRFASPADARAALGAVANALAVCTSWLEPDASVQLTRGPAGPDGASAHLNRLEAASRSQSGWQLKVAGPVLYAVTASTSAAVFDPTVDLAAAAALERVLAGG